MGKNVAYSEMGTSVQLAESINSKFTASHCRTFWKFSPDITG